MGTPTGKAEDQTDTITFTKTCRKKDQNFLKTLDYWKKIENIVRD